MNYRKRCAGYLPPRELGRLPQKELQEISLLPGF
jgi:hypothetical protein